MAYFAQYFTKHIVEPDARQRLKIYYFRFIAKLAIVTGILRNHYYMHIQTFIIYDIENLSMPLCGCLSATGLYSF